MILSDQTSLNKRKVCFVITSVIHYGRNKYILEELKKRPDLELQIVVGASALLSNYGEVLSTLTRDGFHCDAKIMMTLEGGNPVAMAKTTGIGIMEFTSVFDNLRPDVVVIRGDRYEMLSATIAATYLNIPVAHIEGGDVTGTIDESVRHAITKLSQIHFTTNADAYRRVLRMGENPRYVFLTGSPEIEAVSHNGFVVTNEYINQLGVGDVIDVTKPYLIVMQHSVTTEVGSNRAHVEETLRAISEIDMPAIWFWPNVDAGTDEVSKAIRVFREVHHSRTIRFIKYITPEQFIGLLKGAVCLVGNSSTGIKECSHLGIPAVNIGTRQAGRLRGPNVMDVSYNKEEIKTAIQMQVAHGAYAPSRLYFKTGTAKRIAQVLAEIPLYVQKQFHEQTPLSVSLLSEQPEPYVST